MDDAPPRKPDRRPRIRVLHVVGALFVLAVVALAAGTAWLASEPGLRWLVDQAVQRSDGRVATSVSCLTSMSC